MKAKTQPAASYRFLIVDDSSYACMTLRMILEAHGHRVVAEAYTSENALALYKEMKPDMVTMDFNMPGKTGTEIMADILAFDPKALFMVISVEAREHIQARCRPGIIYEYVPKPVVWENLEPAIARMTNR